jgi:glutamyl/glutaminyl-tRNA synthetase
MSLLESYNLSSSKEALKKVIPQLISGNSHDGVLALKAVCIEYSCAVKDIYSLVRLALTGSVKGPAINDLLGMLSKTEIKFRLEELIK